MSNEASSSSGNRVGSVVVDVGRRRNTCGYCKSGRRSSISHGMWAHSLTINDYQDLLDRGWRRSGCFVYKPEMETTCCPQYTIRLRAEEFAPSKEQLRVSRRMQRYIDGIWDGKKQECLDKLDSSHGISCGDVLCSSFQNKSLGTKNKQQSKEEELLDYLSKRLDLATQSFLSSKNISSNIRFPKSSVKMVSQTKKKQLAEGSEDLLYTSNISFQIAAVLRRAMLDGNDAPHGSAKHSLDVTVLSFDLSPKSIAEELAKALQNLDNTRLLVKACNGHINFYSAAVESGSSKDQSVAVSKASSMQYERKGRHVTPENSHRKKRKFEILLNRSKFDPEEFALYKRYQVQVHNDELDDVTESSYKRFLVDTPLIFTPPTSDGTVPPCGFGSFHQQYRIDGQLIAVGVIDILPKCLSSKYLFWDPDFAFLSLGKYSALQEISWVKENQHHCPSLQYYYLGYYIHSCPKMRYKAAYRPSELLCPLRYEWVPFDIAKPLLDRKKHVVLSDYTKAQAGESSLTTEFENPSDLPHNDNVDGDSNDVCMDGDETMVDPDSGSSEDELYPESNDSASTPTTKADVGNILLGIRGTPMRYKDLRRVIGPGNQECLEKQLFRYMKVVGPKLAERMIYSLG